MKVNEPLRGAQIRDENGSSPREDFTGVVQKKNVLVPRFFLTFFIFEASEYIEESFSPCAP
jgi:hypothetical protein